MSFYSESLASKKGNNALITGASEGIGFRVVCGLLKHNTHVYLTARDEALAHAAKKELEGTEGIREQAKMNLTVMELNVLKDESIIMCADKLKASGILLDTLICNAGIATRSMEVTLKTARDCINVNFYGYWKTFEYFRSRGLLTSGCKIIFVSSNMGIMSLERSSKELLHRLFDPNLTIEGLGQIAEHFIQCVEQGPETVKAAGYAVFEHTHTQWDYAFSKALIIIMTRILSKKYEGTYFINTLHPGYVQTAMTHQSKDADLTPTEGAEPIILLATTTQKHTGYYFDRSESRFNLLQLTGDSFMEKAKENKPMMEKMKDKAKDIWQSVKDASHSSSTTSSSGGGTTTTTTTGTGSGSGMGSSGMGSSSGYGSGYGGSGSGISKPSTQSTH